MRAAAPPGGWIGRDCDDSDSSFVTRVTDPRGVVRTAVLDAAGRCTRLSGPLGAQLDCAYDAHGQLVAVTNAPDAQGRRRVDTYAWSQ
jgi:YD repeat-containing protein